METASAANFVTDAYTLLNVISLGTSPDARLSAQGLRFLNMMMGTWAQNALTIPVIARETFALSSGKGSPSNPYTWGTGGDITTSRPPNQNSIRGAALVLTAASPVVEVPLSVLTDDAYQMIAIKDLTSNQPTTLYYNPTFVTTGLGSVYLWPIPLNLANLIAVYRFQQLTAFANLSTIYYFPDGYVEAITFNLAKRIANAGGRSLMPESNEIAVDSFANIQRSNVKMDDMPNDFSLFGAFGDRHSLYNLNTGAGG